jgi:hypothetical protein
MAKEEKKAARNATRKTATSKKRPRTVEQQFIGDLKSVTRAINAAAREVLAGRKQAAAAVARGMTAEPGTPEHMNLPFNQDALKKADQLLAAFNKAKGIMASECCMNVENCDFLVRRTIYKDR